MRFYQKNQILHFKHGDFTKTLLLQKMFYSPQVIMWKTSSTLSLGLADRRKHLAWHQHYFSCEVWHHGQQCLKPWDRGGGGWRLEGWQICTCPQSQKKKKGGGGGTVGEFLRENTKNYVQHDCYYNTTSMAHDIVRPLKPLSKQFHILSVLIELHNLVNVTFIANTLKTNARVFSSILCRQWCYV